MFKIKDRVKIINEDSPIFGREFIVKKVNEQKLTLDLEDNQGNEITLPFSYLDKISLETPKGSTISVKLDSSDPEILFELDGTLIDSNSNPNMNVIKKLKEYSVSHSVGILSYRISNPNDDFISSFIDNYLPDLKERIFLRSYIGPSVRLIFSSRVVRVTEDGSDFCPMCLISNKVTSYSANIAESMIRNTGELQ